MIDLICNPSFRKAKITDARLAYIVKSRLLTAIK